jgi:hypothetical protein
MKEIILTALFFIILVTIIYGGVIFLVINLMKGVICQ